MINILFINNSVGQGGGAERSLYYLIKYLNKSKFLPFLIVPGEGILPQRLNANKIRCKIFKRSLMPDLINKNIFPIRNAVLHGISLLINILRLNIFAIYLAFFAIKNNINVLYCNNLIPKLIGTIAGFLIHKPVIWIVRNIHIKKWRIKMLRLLSKLNIVKYIICVSNATSQQYGGGKNEKVRIIFNGIDLEEYNYKTIESRLRKEYKINNKEFIVGTYGRFVPWKGFDLFLKAAKEVFKRRNDIRFVIIGDATNDKEIRFKQKCERLSEELSISNKVIFTGFKNDVRPYLKDFDIVGIPSINPDPFPRVSLEAMAVGKPIIGTRMGGIPESIKDGITGYIVPPQDPKALCEKILLLLDDKEKRRDFGIKARKHVEASFNIKTKTKEIEQLLERAFFGGMNKKITPN